jgi:hypothetical protein
MHGLKKKHVNRTHPEASILGVRQVQKRVVNFKVDFSTLVPLLVLEKKSKS